MHVPELDCEHSHTSLTDVFATPQITSCHIAQQVVLGRSVLAGVKELEGGVG
jgi:hypothetical protein